MNILILSAGTRNKVVQYFVKTLNGKGTVVATDMSNLAPAIYEADKYYIVPRMTDPGYLDVILDICKKEKITGVLSLIDPELSLLAENREKFEAVGTTVIGSSYDLCEMSLITTAPTMQSPQIFRLLLTVAPVPIQVRFPIFTVPTT